ncbi:MAG: hypothetical protein ACRYGP_06930 [Janthinobacterium lividum]
MAHRIADGSPGLGSYFIDDCACIVVRAYTTAFAPLLSGVDLGTIAPELDRAARLSALMAAMSDRVP